MKNIVDENLPAAVESAQDTVQPFIDKYVSSTISNGSGTQGIPETVENLNSSMDGLKTELNEYENVAKSIHEGAQKGIEFGSNQTELQSAKDGINEALPVFNDLITAVDDFGETFIDFSDHLKNGTEYSYISNMAVGCVTLFLFLFIMFIVICQTKNNKCYGCSCFIKLIIIVLSFFLIILSIALLILLILNIVFGSTCNVFEELLISDDLTTFLTDVDVDVDDEMNDVFTNCISETGSG